MVLLITVLQSNEQYPDYDRGNTEKLLLQLLLFVDQRSSSDEQVQVIKSHLQSLRSDFFFKLDVVEIAKQPHLVEHLKLVVTPALVKMAPEPRQILAGSDLVKQLEKLWPQWKAAVKQTEANSNFVDSTKEPCSKNKAPEFYSASDIKLSDEIFKLQQEKQELLAQLSFKDKFLAMLAHDLRTPLTAASMAVETIELSEKNHEIEAANLEQLKKKLYQQAKNQFGIMDRMIGELLGNAQSANARLAVKPKPVDLIILCQEVIVQFDARLKQKLMNLEQDLPQDIPPVYADRELIRQLMGNLLDNAIKYTPKKGKITLSVLHRTNQKVQVSICDTGPGIPAEKRERIFEDSFRLQRDRSSEGYGLGLATCYKIVLAHYGQIWVDSFQGSGSCFKFTLLVCK